MKTVLRSSLLALVALATVSPARAAEPVAAGPGAELSVMSTMEGILP